jgi:hypothetical protein
MRANLPLFALLTVSLLGAVGVAAFAVAADGNETDHDAAPAHPAPGHNETRENETHNETDEQQRHEELEHARHDAISSFQENRTAALKEYRATLESIRDSFMENKTKVIDACQAARAANNTTDDHCVRDGLKPLIEKAHADIKAAQERLRATLESLRDAALAKFGHDRDDVNVRHHHRSG